MSWQWIDIGFERIGIKYDSLSQYLIQDRRLRLSFPDSKLDCIDLRGAKLISASLANRKSLCLVLPDANPKRPAFLFAYALLNQWYKSRENLARTLPNILYCGSHTGIRSQLENVSVSGLSASLAEVFQQTDLKKGGISSPSQNNPTIPRVVTAFSPAEPERLIDDVRPSFIALDIADSPDLPWIQSLILGAMRTAIPILAWGTNPLSNCFVRLKPHSHFVQWPFGRTFSEDAEYEKAEESETLFKPYLITNVRAVLVSAPISEQCETLLRKSYQSLMAVSDDAQSTFARKAVAQYWRLHKTLETLSVPLSLYEAEAPDIWGCDTVDRQIAICQQFTKLIGPTAGPLAVRLEAVLDSLCSLTALLQTNDPPLWDGAIQFLKSELPPEQAHFLVFPTRARKTLFALALLAKLNITSEDLKARQVWLATLEELTRYSGYGKRGSVEFDDVPRDCVIVPSLVGLPSQSQVPKLWPLFLGEDAQIILHRFQEATMSARLRAWSASLGSDITPLIKALAELQPFPRPHWTLAAPPRATIVEPIHVVIGGTPSNRENATGDLFNDSLSLEDELRSLLREEEDDDDDELVFTDENAVSAFDDGDRLVHSYWRVEFTDGWTGHFADDAKFNYVSAQYAVDERAVRSLRAGDTVLIIPNQRKQSLYTLVVSRIHRHPAIELHLTILRKWREELIANLEKWATRTFGQRRPWTPRSTILENFLRELGERGSSLTSIVAIKFWLSGVTLCPHDPDDIKRVGEILQAKFIVEQHRRIATAAQRIRGLHRGLSIRLNSWLSDYPNMGMRVHDGEVIDQETKLTFGDVRTSIVLAKVEKLERIVAPAMNSQLGIVERRTI